VQFIRNPLMQLAPTIDFFLHVQHIIPDMPTCWVNDSLCGQTRGAVVKIFILGATGNSGRRILRLALQRAHEVTAFVRDETKLLSVVDRPIAPNLHVSIGDISK